MIHEPDATHRSRAATAPTGSGESTGTVAARRDATEFPDQDESYVRYMASWLEEEEPVNWGELWVFAPANREPDVSQLPVSEAA